VCTRAGEHDGEGVGGGRERPFLCDNLPHCESPIDVTAEDHLHVVDRATLEDRARARVGAPMADLA